MCIRDSSNTIKQYFGITYELSTYEEHALSHGSSSKAMAYVGTVSYTHLARRQGISDKYLEQIISVLNKAKYVKSIRGAQGGYILTKKPEEYTIGMILRLTEGSLAPVACVEEENTCEKIHDCATILVWQKMNEAINDVVDHKMCIRDRLYCYHIVYDSICALKCQ